MKVGDLSINYEYKISLFDARIIMHVYITLYLYIYIMIFILD